MKRWGAVGAAVLAALAVSPLIKSPGRLLAACAKWITVAAGFELLSVLGFVLVFVLVFGASSGGRPGVGAGLRALGAITVLPAGGVIGPGLAVRASTPDGGSVRSLARSTVALTILTNAPEVLVLAVLSVSLWLGWPDGPHDALRTLPAAGVAVAVVPAVVLVGRRRGVLGDGAAEARALVGDRNWRLAGALGYYAFDNAVLWAAFHAYGGRAPAVSVVVMGYLVGSVGTLVPLPAGIGAVEGGLFGALVLYGAPAAPAAGAVLLYRAVSVSVPVLLSTVAWALHPRNGPRATPAGRVMRSLCAARDRRALSSRSRTRESRPTNHRHRMSRWRRSSRGLRQGEGPR